MEAPTRRDLPEVLRDGLVQAPRVLDALRDGPKSIPEIAKEVGAPTWEVMLWVMALRRYGRIGDVPKGPADDYYRYRRLEERP
jgi:predicted Rossmann fold nucleotide-binding protein DprA/Smf involved in DNA uptake